MFNKKNVVLVTVMSLLFAFGGFYTSEKYFEKESYFNYEKKNNSGLLVKKISDNNVNVDEEREEPESLETSSSPKIIPTTKIVYEYYYLKDNIIKKEEGLPMYFLLDLTFNDLKDMYPDWNILSFSENEVVMRKLVNEESEEHYIVGQKDGYITVFYDKEKDGTNIHEITDISVEGLSETEKVLLNDGIYVIGQENLSKILEDYGS